MAENDNHLQLVTFQLGEERYGINIMDVNEIYRQEDIRTIPNAPSYVEGIFNLRGNIIPIINLHRRFHIKEPNLSEEDKMLSGFVILDINGMKLGVIIDKVLRVVTVDKDKIQPPPQMISGIGAEYIKGVIQEENGYLIILDIHRLFNPKELRQIENMKK